MRLLYQCEQKYYFTISNTYNYGIIWIELMLKWCFWVLTLEKTLESTLDCMEIKLVHPKGNQSKYSLEGLMLELKLQCLGHLMRRANSLERSWCWDRLRAGGEGDDRGWDGWMASLTPWTWVWANSGRQWRTGKPGVLQSMGSQRVRHDWATE